VFWLESKSASLRADLFVGIIRWQLLG